LRCIAVLGAGAVVGVVIANADHCGERRDSETAAPIEVQAAGQTASPRVLLAQRAAAEAGN
jgi:hypothetical protein